MKAVRCSRRRPRRPERERHRPARRPCRGTPDLALFALPTADGGWTDVTAAEFHARSMALAKGFVAAGIQPGDKIGLMCKTRYEWTLIDFATWFAGAVLVPIYETSSPSQVLWNLDRLRRRSASSPRPPTTSRASTRSAADAARGQPRLADRPRRPRQARRLRRDGRGRRDRAPPHARQGRRTWPPSSTRRAPPDGPRAASSRHSNFVEIAATRGRAMPEVVNPQVAAPCCSSPRPTSSRASSRCSACTAA